MSIGQKISTAIVVLIALLSIVVGCFMLTGCTANQSVKSLGGNKTINLPVNTKLTDIEWEGEDLWYMTRPMREDEIAETHTFQEQSSHGAFEGVVTIVETKE